jgi:hypothetical protein
VLVSPVLLERRAQIDLVGEQTLLFRLRRLITQKEREREANRSLARPQTDLFEQAARVLLAVAAQMPLLLVIDDLHWADLGTIGLLAHLGRRIGQGRILLTGAFRLADLTGGRRGQRHPLESVVFELQPSHGSLLLALEEGDGQRFVNTLLDRDLNALDDSFRRQLYQITQGNALFTVELLAAMQSRGDLLRDEQGYWRTSGVLRWDALPARSEAVIAERIRRLPPELREVLTVACVEGERFTAEVVVQVLHSDLPSLVRWLSGELDRQHRLVVLQGVQHLGDQPITHYRFRHNLFQKYLYSQLDQAERIYTHAAVASALEALQHGSAEASEEIAATLAYHFEQAMAWSKAAEYLLVSSRRTLRLAALDEAIMAAKRGSDLAQHALETPERRHLRLALYVTQGIAWTLCDGYTLLEARRCFEQAELLSYQGGDASDLFAALFGLAGSYRIGAQLQHSLQVGQQMLRLAKHLQNDSMLATAQVDIGSTLVFLGRLPEARQYLESALAAQRRTDAMPDFGSAQHPTVLALGYLAFALWPLGYPELALACVHEARSLGVNLAHANSEAFAIFFEILVHLMCRDIEGAKQSVQQLRLLAEQHPSIHFWITWLNPYLGWLAFEDGQIEKGMAILHDWLPLVRIEKPATSPLTWQFAALLMALCKAEEIEEGLALAPKVIDYAHRLGEHWRTAELYRLHGDLLLRRSPAAWLDASGEAEARFQQAIAFARAQEAKGWELRAANSLAALWQRQGKLDAAFRLLKPLYDWFSEGFGAYDLQKAGMLLNLLQVQGSKDAGSGVDDTPLQPAP